VAPTGVYKTPASIAIPVIEVRNPPPHHEKVTASFFKYDVYDINIFSEL